MSNDKQGGKKTRKTKKKASLPAFGFTDDLLKGGGKAEAGGTAAAGGEEGPAAPPAGGGEETPSSPPEERRVSLPAFGFAEDLLKQLKRQQSDPPDEAAAAPTGTTQATGAETAETESAAAGIEADLTEETAAEAAAAAAASAEAHGEDRIFAFADGLEAVVGDSEKVAPVRLETWVSFTLAGETFALPVDPVHEIVRPSSITRVPHAPFPIRGVTNLRGRVVPVIDLRLRLELPEGEVSRSSRIIVVGSRGRRLGLLVDAVHQVVHLDLDQVHPPPEDVMTLQSDYISGVYYLGEELILLLHVDRVLIIKENPSQVPPPGPVAARPDPQVNPQGAA